MNQTINKKKLNYVIFEDLSVHLINDKIKTAAIPFAYIQSICYKKSSGLGLINYYNNNLYDANHKRIEENELSFSGIYCKIEEKEVWRIIRGNTGSSTCNAIITDKTGITIERLFDMYKPPQLRFDEIFYYLRLLALYGTHKAVDKIIDLERKIHKLNVKK